MRDYKSHKRFRGNWIFKTGETKIVSRMLVIVSTLLHGKKRKENIYKSQSKFMKFY